MKKGLFSCLFILICLSLHAQMWNGQDTLYGNEWIDYGQTYFNIKVAEDGIYQIDYQALNNAGFPLSSISAQAFRLYRNGLQIPIFTSTDGLFGPQDWIAFYGQKNRGEIDFYLFDHPTETQINPRYSLFNDTAAYYLGWETSGQALRVTTLNNDLSNLPPPLPYCWQTVERVMTDAIFKKKISDEIQFSWYDGNGYARPGSATATPVPLSLPKIWANGPDAKVQVRYAGNLGPHEQNILLNDSIFANNAFVNFKVIDQNFTVNPSYLTPSTTLRLQSPIGDRQGLALVRIQYPRLFDLENAAFAEFELEASANAQYLEIQAFNSSSGTPILWNITQNTRLEATLQGGLVRAKIPPSTSAQQYILFSPSAVRRVNTLTSTTFSLPQTTAADYLIISHRAFFDDGSGQNPVAEYAEYRRSAAGGNHTVQVVDIADLYEQFAYGVRFHPIAVRNYLHWAKRQWPESEHVLLIGKALDAHQFRTSAQQNALADSLFFIPTFSLPGADLPFVMSGNQLSDPIMAIGRLAVTRRTEIRDYLDKVILQEQQATLAGQQITDKAWMKRVIHNSGGLANETSAIKNYTTSMANALINNRFGAEVTTFYKTSNDPVQLSAYEQLLDLMNEGVAVWSIFGHSSAFTVDFDIGQPSAYTNYGRYPLMMILGCFSGQCSLTQPGIGEQFVLAPERGAIAYIASVNYSFTDALHKYGRQYYERLGGVDYGRSVGQTLVGTIRDLKSTQSPGLIAVLHQNLLQGDPAIRVYAHDGPDYLIDNQRVEFNPNPIGLENTRVQLKFDAVNIGENTSGQIPLKIEQRLPDNTVLTRILDTIQAPANRATFQYEVPLAGSQVGFNRFYISLDADNSIPENPAAAETNNDLIDASGQRGMDVFCYADDVSPVYPAAYAIVSKAPVALCASTLNSSAAMRRYRFEADTTPFFNSPFLQSATLEMTGGLLRWLPPISLKDSVVYHWRVARDSLINGSLLWRNRSFIYLPSSSAGWNQSEYGQFRDNDFSNLVPNDTSRNIAFSDNAAFISVQVAYRGVNRYPGLQNSFYENFLGDFGWNQQNVSRGVALVVAHPNTGRLQVNPAGGPYNYAPAKERKFFWFDTRDSLQRLKLMDFIENGIPNGHYVGLLAFNTPTDLQGYAPNQWAKDSISQGKNLFQVLENQGATKIRQTVQFNAAPPAYGLVFRKNTPNYPALDTIVNDPDALADIRANFSAKWSVGQVETPVIGPVKSWTSLHWARGVFDDGSDEARLAVLAVRAGQPDTLLFRLENTFDTSLVGLSAGDFPRLRLRYEVSDTLTRTPTHLGFVRVLYEGVPEGAIHPAAHFTFQRDTVQQGENLRASVAFVNISEANFDSLQVKFRVENPQGTGKTTVKTFAPLTSGDSLHLDFSTPTLSFQGTQRWVVEANPDENQPELFHFNNVLLHDFYVQTDIKNPLLDVTFDGQHVLDGDLVSPKPLIVITLKDENPFLGLSDSSLFTLTLVRPDGAQQVISANDPSLLFFPADAGHLPKKNLARLEWRPEFLDDGTYRLLVNGRDASGNASGALDWSVNFQIVTRSSLSNLLNYPNPFSTSTCFVYTLTGSEPPTFFKIQIMTVSGRVVREITEQEFGPLKPGVQRSDYCWNGRDEFGDQLANGVYLYRVVAKKADGSAYELFSNDATDGFFQHGFGKMVLMR